MYYIRGMLDIYAANATRVYVLFENAPKMRASVRSAHMFAWLAGWFGWRSCVSVRRSLVVFVRARDVRVSCLSQKHRKTYIQIRGQRPAACRVSNVHARIFIRDPSQVALARAHRQCCRWRPTTFPFPKCFDVCMRLFFGTLVRCVVGLGWVWLALLHTSIDVCSFRLCLCVCVLCATLALVDCTARDNKRWRAPPASVPCGCIVRLAGLGMQASVFICIW